MSLVDPLTARDIDKKTEKLLKEIGIKEPPVDLNSIISHLSIYRDYYDLGDPTLLHEIKHKVHIGSKKVKNIFGKISLQGLWFPEENKILIDKQVPNSKEKFVTAHEIIHKILPTHNYLLGDTAETLEYDYQEMIEAEANYGASGLIFLNQTFKREAKDYELTIKSIQNLKKRYQNSMTSTFRRFIECNADIAIAGIISSPDWEDDLDNVQNRCRYFIRSNRFKEQFSNLNSTHLMNVIEAYTIPRKGGPVGQTTHPLLDINNNKHEFIWESFYNRYDILTLLRYNKAL
ncbi:MAG: ImmA/IrrE family metallo-endopeptidase [Bacteroidota bacterium]|nr:ImmA/IrrE family metallo-endopeptidase [Bacteroidota bacterium]